MRSTNGNYSKYCSCALVKECACDWRRATIGECLACCAVVCRKILCMGMEMSDIWQVYDVFCIRFLKKDVRMCL